jgi:hypothetical protein
VKKLGSGSYGKVQSRHLVDHISDFGLALEPFRTFRVLIDSGLLGSTGFHSPHPQGHEVPREQKMLKGHLPRVVYHRLYFSIRR